MNLACLTAAILAVTSPGDPSTSTMLIDFRADWCGPCRSMDPAVEHLIGDGFPVRRVNIDQERELATRFGVQGIPCFVMIVNGKEVDRVVGATDPSRLQAMFSRNGVGPAVSNMRAQSPGNSNIAAGANPQSVPFPQPERRGLLGGLSRPSLSSNPPSGRVVEMDPPIVSKTRPFGDDAADSHEKLIRATVRLKIEDDAGISVGSGTIIDSREGEALIITCGHVFREAAKGGRIMVDLFGPNAPHGVLGHLIDYDLKSEVGLVRIESNYPLVAAHVAPQGYAVREGDSVISIGCDSGADATAKETRVTAINKYAGAKNVEVGFQPVQGRSGGGLFTTDGLVVGVCYAADPEANEGLFAALPALCDELDKSGLAFVYRNESPSREFDNRHAQNNAGGESGKYPVANLASAAQGEKLKQAELICIVHPQDDPQAKSDVFVLDHVSPGLMQQLVAERSSSTQRLTSLETPREPAVRPAAKSTTASSAPTAQQLDLAPWWSEYLKP